VRRRSTLLVLLLAGCAPTLDAIRPAVPAGTDFFATLSREQRRHAVALARFGATVPAAERFARKAVEAASGHIPEPEPAATPELEDFRSRLLAMLDTPARQRCPVFAALALARYDAWAERDAAWPGAEESTRYRNEAAENLATASALCTAG
jgi:hypothetical protein